MTITVVGRANTAREAENIVRDLVSMCHCDRADISLSAIRSEYAEPARSGGGVAAGAMKGLVGGAVVGAIIGFVIGAASIPVPGFESVMARGPSATIIVCAIIGSVLGILVGALGGIERRTDGEQADEGAAKRAGTLITVHARENQEADCVINIMRRHGAREIDKRSSDWNKHDWTDYHDKRDWTDHHVPAQEAALRAVPDRPAHSAAAPEAAPRAWNRPMEEAARASAPEPAAPAVAREPIPAGDGAKEQAALAVDTSTWITRKYTATYFGPERRKAANQTPYQGAEKRHSV